MEFDVSVGAGSCAGGAGSAVQALRVRAALPLWHGIGLVRGLTTGALGPALFGHVLYYVVMIVVGLVMTTSRLKKLFLD